jgi:hypothetical protein
VQSAGHRTGGMGVKLPGVDPLVETVKMRHITTNSSDWGVELSVPETPWARSPCPGFLENKRPAEPILAAEGDHV